MSETTQATLVLPVPKRERYAVRHVTLPDGVRLAVTEGGAGRPLLMFHGWLAHADGNWIQTGIADAFVDAGYRVIMVDHRGHGVSDRPRVGPDTYPTDVLARDGLAVVEALGLTDYDLCGYSIGARTALRMVVRGAKPRRVVLAGLGAGTLIETPEDIAAFEAAMTGPAPAADDMAIPSLLRKMADQTGVDSAAAIAILRSTPPTPWADMTAAFDMPTLLILGVDDLGIGPPEPIQAAIADAELRRIEGDHITCLLNPALSAWIVAFLDRPEE